MGVGQLGLGSQCRCRLLSSLLEPRFLGTRRVREIHECQPCPRQREVGVERQRSAVQRVGRGHRPPSLVLAAAKVELVRLGVAGGFARQERRGQSPGGRNTHDDRDRDHGEHGLAAGRTGAKPDGCTAGDAPPNDRRDAPSDGIEVGSDIVRALVPLLAILPQ